MIDEFERSKLRVIVIVGTRPEAIKLFPVIRRLRESLLLEPFVILTGQHRDLVAPVFEMAEIEPDVDLNVGSEPRTLNGLVAAIVDGVEDVVTDLRATDQWSSCTATPPPRWPVRSRRSRSGCQ